MALGLAVPRIALADNPPARVDIVELNDGSRLMGSITEMKRGVYVIIETTPGQPQKVPWSKVKNVLRDQPAPPPGQAPAPAPTPAPAPVPAPELQRSLPAAPPGAAPAPAPAAPPQVSSAPASPPPPGASPRVALTLRDGRIIIGTLLSANPSSGYSLVTDDGRTATYPFDAVAGTKALPSRDRVLLDDGTTVEGVVTDLRPGVSVTINDRILPWPRVRDVVVRKRPADLPPAAGALAAGAAAGAAITTTTQIRADSSGASYDIVKDCTGGPDAPQCHEHTHVAMGPGGPTASFESEDANGRRSANISSSGLHAGMERDCAANPQDERCTEKAGLDVGANGKVGLGYSKTTVTRVKEPGSSSVNFNLDAGAIFVFITVQGSNSTLFGATADLSIPMLFGGKFPGKEGGGWFGIKLEPYVGFSASFGSMTFGGVTAQINQLAWTAGGRAFLQYMHWGKLDEKTLKQSGFGIAAGGSFGAQGTTTSTTVDGQSSPATSSTDSSLGPAFELTFPSYNAGTAHVSATNILFLVLPTGSATIFMVSLGMSF